MARVLRTPAAERSLDSVVFQRSYRDGAGERRFLNSFTAADLPVLRRVFELAEEYVDQIEAAIDNVNHERSAES